MRARAFTSRMWAVSAILLQEIRAIADAPTFLEVFRANRGYAWRALKYLGVRDAELDDACQEVFLVVHRDLPSFDGESRVSTWIYAICLRVASTFRRRTARRTARELLPDPDAQPTRSSDASPHDALERAEARDTLRELLDALDEDRRVVYVLAEIEQLPMSEVAALVGCPVQTGYSRLRAARAELADAARRLRARGGQP